MVNECGGKILVMNLMGHDDSDVRYNALMAVRTLMTHAW